MMSRRCTSSIAAFCSTSPRASSASRNATPRTSSTKSSSRSSRLERKSTTCAQGRAESLPEDFGDQQDPGGQGLADKFATQMTVHQALQYLPQKCRETLWLHYFEGRSAGE